MTDVDGAAAAQGLSAAEDDKGLVGAGVLEELVGLDQGPAHLGSIGAVPGAARGGPAPAARGAARVALA